MSAINGDKSRFNRKRRQKIDQRKRNRELVKKLAEQGKAAGAGPKQVSA